MGYELVQDAPLAGYDVIEPVEKPRYDVIEPVAKPRYDVIEPVAKPRYDVIEPAPKPDLSHLQASPVHQDSGLATDSTFLASVANDPKGFLKSLPGDVLGVAGGLGKLPYAAAADAVSKAFNDPEYGGNLRQMAENPDEPAPVDTFLASLSKSNPALATVGKLAKGVAETAPMAAVGALPAAVQRAAVVGFTTDMLYHAPQTAHALYAELQKPKADQDPDKVTSLISDGLMQTGFGALGAKHLAGELGDRLAAKYVPAGAGVRTPGGPVAPAMDAAALKAAMEFNPGKPVEQKETKGTKETIATPAVKVAGTVVPGVNHDAATDNAKAAGLPTGEEEDGFVTTTGRFVDREEAADISGLPTNVEPGKLHSEDLPASSPEPAFIGMGGAVPAEYVNSPVTPTSIKNATVDAERAKRGLPAAMQPARRSFGTVWDEAMATVDGNPERQDALIEELRAGPRPVSDLEDALLLHRQIDLQNEYGKVTRDLAQAHDDAQQFPGRAADAEELRIRAAKLSDELLELYDINKAVGTATARGLNARKMMAYEDYSLAKMVLDKRAAKGGGPLTEQEQADVQRQQETITRTQQQLDTHLQQADEQQSNQAATETVKEIVDRVDAERDSRPRGTRADTVGEGQRLETAIRAAHDGKRPLSDLGSLIQKLAEHFVRHGIKEREPLIDAVHGVVKGIIPEMTRRQTMDAISGYGDFKPLNPDAVKTELRGLKGQMQQVAKLEDLQARKPLLKSGLERRVPTDEERRLIKQVNELKRRLGVVTTDPARQLKSALEAVKTRLKNQIADLEHQIGTRTKIVKTKTPTPTDAEADLLRIKRDQLKQDFDAIFAKPEMTDAQRVKLAMDAAQRQIALYELRLKTGDASPLRPGSRTPLTPELEAVRARRDALREEFQHLQDLANPGRRDAASLSALKTRLANRTAELQDRLARADFAARPRRQLKLDAEATRLKVENEKAKNAFQRALTLDRLAHRTVAEKAQDTLVKWRRGFLLSLPVTLAKLTAAAAQRMAFTPVEEAIGAGIGRVIPGIAGRAPREGGFSVRAEAQAITQAFTRGLADAWHQLRSGESELDIAHGHGREDAVNEGKLLPRSVIDFFGQLHGALKAPVKRAEFARSFEKRIAWNLKQGVDVSDPLVQMRIAVEAYKDAQRAVFLQSNWLVDRVQRFFAPKIDKDTGRATPGSKALATAGKLMLPIVRVPTNIVGETFQYATGLVTGSARVAAAIRSGVDSLPPDHADLILRDLKKGALGSAFLTLGFLLPSAFGGYYQQGEKRKPGDLKAGSVKLFGHEVPSYLVHNPLLETLQMGATMRRVADSKLRKTDAAPQGVLAGALAAGLGLTEEVPFVREQLEWAKAWDPHQRTGFFGELAKSIAIPQLVQWVAARGDRDSSGNAIPRKPQTFGQHLEMGVPGLRQNVPENAQRKKEAAVAAIVADGKAGRLSQGDLARRLGAAGVTSPEAQARVKEQILLSPLAYSVKYLPAASAMDTFKLAKDGDRKDLAPILAPKLARRLAEVQREYEKDIITEAQGVAETRELLADQALVTPYLPGVQTLGGKNNHRLRSFQ